MSHKHLFKHLCEEEAIIIIVASIGVGMVLAIVLPFWWWIIIVGVCLIIYAFRSYFW